MKGFLGSLQSWMNCCTARLGAGQESRALGSGSFWTFSCVFHYGDTALTMSSLRPQIPQNQICLVNGRTESYVIDWLIIICCYWAVFEPKKQFLMLQLDSTDMAFRALLSVRRTVGWWASPADVYCIFFWSSQPHGSWFLHVLFHFAINPQKNSKPGSASPCRDAKYCWEEWHNSGDGPLPLVIGEREIFPVVTLL